jgi:hypothetical protein
VDDDGRLKAAVRRLLVDAGLFVDADFWAISVYTGVSPTDLRPAPGARRPVLGARDVTDVEAVFVADPFMLRADEGWHMFFEVFDRVADLGRIALASSLDGLHWSYQQVVLREPFHLSYPHVFRWDGDHYMVPETSSQNRVSLYRARDYPTSWERDSTLLEGGPFNDASLVHHEGRWWMFVETSDHAHSDTLRLYHADDLRGPWAEHARSPVVEADATCARPAGRVVSHGGRLLRFAQDCTTVYGRSVSVSEIVDMDTSTYRERRWDGAPVLEPAAHGWNDLGMHHVDAHEVAPGRWLACVDGRPQVGLRRPPRLPATQRARTPHRRASEQ